MAILAALCEDHTKSIIDRSACEITLTTSINAKLLVSDCFKMKQNSAQKYWAIKQIGQRYNRIDQIYC